MDEATRVLILIVAEHFASVGPHPGDDALATEAARIRAALSP